MTSGIHKGHVKGPQHHLWNDKKMISIEGYVKIRVGKEHPLSDVNGYAYEHLLVWVSAGNPKPGYGQILHHKDENKQNNRLGNLELKTRVRHSVDHYGILSDEQVRSIREKYNDCVANMMILADIYQVRVSLISKIVRGETRLSAGGPINKFNRKNRKFSKTQAGEI